MLVSPQLTNRWRTVCTLVFEAETEEEDVMRRPPRPPAEPLFSWPLVFWSVLQGSLVFVLVGFAAGVLNVTRSAAEMNRASPPPPGSDLGPGKDEDDDA